MVLVQNHQTDLGPDSCFCVGDTQDSESPVLVGREVMIEGEKDLIVELVGVFVYKKNSLVGPAFGAMKCRMPLQPIKRQALLRSCSKLKWTELSGKQGYVPPKLRYQPGANNMHPSKLASH